MPSERRIDPGKMGTKIPPLKYSRKVPDRILMIMLEITVRKRCGTMFAILPVDKI
jgi:hypothetical protein